MADQTLAVRITATDNATPALQKVGAAMQKVGQEAQQAGTQASAGLSKADQAATKAESSASKLTATYDKVRGAGASLGIVLSSVGELFGESAKLAAESDAVQQRLAASVTATGHAYAEYASQLDAATNAAMKLGFDDEQANAALATLTQETGSATAAIKELGLAEDLARARNIDLESSAEIIGRVYTGNIGILSRYGISVQQGATAQEALAEIQAKVAGQAQAAADSTQGSLDRMRVALENFGEAVGHAMGPLAPFVALLPGLSAGGTIVAGALGHLAEILLRDDAAATEATAANLELAASNEALAASEAEVGAASLGAEAGSAGLLAALGPIGLVAAAAAAAVGIIALTKNVNDFQSASDAAKTAADSFAETVAKLRIAGEGAAADVAQGMFTDVNNALALGAKAADQLTQIKSEIEQAQTYGNAAKLNGGTPADIASQDRFLANLKETQTLLTSQALSQKQIDSIRDSLTKLFQEPGLDAPAAAAAVEHLVQEQRQGKISGDQLVAGVANLTTHWYDYTTAVEAANKAQDANNSLLGKAAQAAADVLKRGAQQETTTDKIANALGLPPDWQAQLKAYDASLAARRAAMIAEKEATNHVIAADVAFAEQQKQAIQDAYAATSKTAADLTQQLGAMPSLVDLIAGKAQGASVGDQLGAGFGQAEQAAVGLRDAMAAYDAVTRVAIDDTGNLIQSVDKTQKWADDLINVEGIHGKIDDLLRAGVITQNEYNAAQLAYNNLTADNLGIQNDLLKIQTDQAPLVARQTDALQAQVHTIAQLPAAQQEVALGFLDQAEAQKVSNAVTLAGTAAMSGFTGEAEAAIQKAAESDPVFRAMAESIGLISEKGGQIHVNFDQARSLNADIENLTKSIDALTRALGGIPQDNTITVDTAAATKNIQDLEDAYRGLRAQPLPEQVMGGGAFQAGGGAGVSVPTEHQYAVQGSAFDTAPKITTLNVTADASQFNVAMADVGAKLAALGKTTATPKIFGDDTDAQGKIAETSAGMATVGAATATPKIFGDDSDFLGKQDETNSGLGQLNSASATPAIYGDDADALGKINDVAANLAALDGTSATVSVVGDTSPFWDAVGAINGQTVGVAYINTIETGFAGAPSSGVYATPFALGGVAALPAAALGTTRPGTTLVGEYGPELVNLPPGSYVTTHATSVMRGGEAFGPLHITIPVYGNVYGIDDLAEQVTRQMVPALQAAVARQRRGQGGA